MEQNYDNESSLDQVNVKDPKRMRNNEDKSNKCNQCEYASLRAHNLRMHLITHSGEKSKNDRPGDDGTLRSV